MQPVTRSERIESIDVLRGVAVLGILALNIQSFAMPGSAYLNPTSYGNLVGVNYWIWYIVHLLGDTKFWSIFSMLFGAGIVLMTERCEATGRSAAGVHFRRMAWLLMIGLIHAHLIWYGDILYTYAMCGLVLYFFRKLRPATLIGLAVIPLLIAFAISWGFGWLLASETVPQMNKDLAKTWSEGSDEALAELEIYRDGWASQMPHRSKSAFFFETFLFLTVFGWRSAGLMLLGMAFYKLGLFSAARSRTFYLFLLSVGVSIGLPLVAWGIYRNEQENWALEYSFFFGPMYNYWGSILVALGWVSVVMLVCKSEWSKLLVRPFAAAGQMALTCYLLQSLIATTIFYGHGFGWFGYMERWQQLLTVIGIWIFCLVFATLWLEKFRFGPFEWLWRCLTYWKIQPIRKS